MNATAHARQPRRWRDVVALLLAVVLATVFAIALALEVESWGGDSFDRRFEPAVRRAGATGQPLDLGVVGPGDWQRVFVVSDYADRRVAERNLGVSWPDGDGVFGQRDATFHLLFVRDRKVVSSATVGNAVACLDSNDGYSRSTRFTVHPVQDASLITVRGQQIAEDC